VVLTSFSHQGLSTACVGISRASTFCVDNARFNKKLKMLF